MQELLRTCPGVVRTRVGCIGGEVVDPTCDHVNHAVGKVVTEVTPAGTFWEAGPEHQNYLQRYPHAYTCHYVRER